MSPEKFPLQIEFINRSGRVVHTIDVPGPGVIPIPGLAPFHGPVSARVRFGDGTVIEEKP